MCIWAYGTDLVLKKYLHPDLIIGKNDYKSKYPPAPLEEIIAFNSWIIKAEVLNNWLILGSEDGLVSVYNIEN